ncbi:hypothetical protein BKA62DRAFT_765171 [Auriculariales sp. MPI-PUGE-AT-0066]|nr:hypothetical protein BKA62DRAFT_765171 [Auriculariales sp. MPI-PUGE-AT-0066]
MSDHDRYGGRSGPSRGGGSFRANPHYDRDRERDRRGPHGGPPFRGDRDRERDWGRGIESWRPSDDYDDRGRRSDAYHPRDDRGMRRDIDQGRGGYMRDARPRGQGQDWRRGTSPNRSMRDAPPYRDRERERDTRPPPRDARSPSHSISTRSRSRSWSPRREQPMNSRARSRSTSRSVASDHRQRDPSSAKDAPSNVDANSMQVDTSGTPSDLEASTFQQIPGQIHPLPNRPAATPAHVSSASSSASPIPPSRRGSTAQPLSLPAKPGQSSATPTATSSHANSPAHPPTRGLASPAHPQPSSSFQGPPARLRDNMETENKRSHWPDTPSTARGPDGWSSSSTPDALARSAKRGMGEPDKHRNPSQKSGTRPLSTRTQAAQNWNKQARPRGDHEIGELTA